MHILLWLEHRIHWTNRPKILCLFVHCVVCLCCGIEKWFSRLSHCANKTEFIVNSFCYYHQAFANFGYPFHSCTLSLTSQLNNSYRTIPWLFSDRASQFIFLFGIIAYTKFNLVHDIFLLSLYGAHDLFIGASLLIR